MQVYHIFLLLATIYFILSIVNGTKVLYTFFEVRIVQQNGKSARRHFSLIGASLLLFMVMAVLLQSLCSAAASMLFPALMQNPWVYFSVYYLPYYLLAVPYAVVLLRLNTFGVPPKNKMRFGELISFLPICFTLSYIGNWMGNILNTVISFFKGSMPENALEGLLEGTTPLVTLVFVVILAPIFEELVFRKLLIDALYPYGEKVCIVLSALLFGVFHGNFYQFFYAALVGALFAFVYCRTGKVIYSIILHALFNLLGGLVTSTIISLLDAAALAEGDTIRLLVENPIGTIVYFLYGFWMFGLAILGFILLIRKMKKTRLMDGEVKLARPLLTAVFNVGILLFLFACGLMFLLSI